MSTIIDLSSFDEYKLNTKFGKDYCEHTITNESGLVETEKWSGGKHTLVGGGTFGEVWWESSGDKLRAVKRIYGRNIVSTKDKTYKNKPWVTRELKALIEMGKYPDYFVVFFGWFEGDEGHIHFAMEYIENGDLGSYLKRRKIAGGPIPEGDTRSIARQLLEGLKIMHAKNFCHRDLKPQNILMVSFSPPRVKIADFGISKEVLEDGSLLSTEVGAKGYMAPEVTLRPFPMAYDTAVDIWSLGCVIYIILTHEHLFPPVHSFTLEAYSLNETLLVQKLQQFSPAAAQFIANLTRVEPSERLTAQQALNDRWLADPLSGKALAVQNARPGFRAVPLPRHGLTPVLVTQGRPWKEPRVGVDSNPTLLHLAAETGDVERVMLLLEGEEGVNIEAMDRKNRTPLHFAAISGRLEVVSILLEKGAVIEAVDIGKFTPLHWAAHSGHLKVVALLLEKGAAIEAAEGIKFSPLLSAAVFGHLEVAKLLLEKGASIEAVDTHGCNPLHMAAILGNLEVAKLMIEKGAVVEVTDVHGLTPLHYAASKGHFEVVEWLLEKGVIIEAVNVRGFTPLHMAAISGHLKVVKLLLEMGAAIEAVDVHDSTPLHWAASKGYLEVVKLLLEKGAVVEAVNKDNRTPLLLATHKGFWEVEKFLLGMMGAMDTDDSDSVAAAEHLDTESPESPELLLSD